MNKYKWNYNELRQNLAILETIYNEVDENIKYNIETMIEMYKNMLKLANRNDKESFNSFDDNLSSYTIVDLIKEINAYYKEENFEILNTLLGIFIPVHENYLLDDTDNYKIIANNNDIVNIAKNFFKEKTPADIYNEFNKVINNHDSFLNITYNKENSDYTGVSIYDCFLKKKYVNISRTNHLLDLIVLPHEMFHYILNDYDVGIVNYYNSYYLTEVEGSFANILFGEYFKENSTENNNFFSKYYLNVFQNEIDELAIRNQVLDSLKNNNQIRLNKLNKFMKYYELEEFKDINEINEYLEMPEEINIKYTLSYLTAIDLYYIYQKDRDFAFYLLKNIRYHKTENDIINLLRRNHITFMDDDYSNYKKYVKTIKNEEKI